jgi:hypothetical protein
MEKRKLQLSGRKEATRNKSIPSVVRFELDEIKQHYKDSEKSIQSMFSVVDYLIENENEDQAKDIMRAQIVFLVGALDFFMHEITKFGLRKIFNDEWEQTKKYSHINVPMSILNEALISGEDSDWFLEFVNQQYSTVTIVSYESVKDQLNLLGLNIQALADDVFYDLNSRERTSDKLKNRLNGLFNRRNLIAHQLDRKHANAEKLDIDRCLVEEFINDVNNIVEAISKQVLEK